MAVGGLCAKLARWPITDRLARLSSAMRWRIMMRGKWRIALRARDLVVGVAVSERTCMCDTALRRRLLFVRKSHISSSDC